MKKILWRLNQFVSWSAIICLLSLSALLMVTRLTLPGNWHLYSVVSASMQPNIPLGSLVITKKPRGVRSIRPTVVIAFKEPGQPRTIVTHRVVGTTQLGSELLYKTQGDLNPNPDPWLVSYKSIQGVYRYHVPGLGTVIGFIRTPLGTGLCIILPILIIVIQELYQLTQTLSDMKVAQLQRQQSPKRVLSLGA